MSESKLEDVKKHWKQDFVELQEDIKILSERLNDFMSKVESATTIEELGYLSDCIDLESGLKHIVLF